MTMQTPPANETVRHHPGHSTAPTLFPSVAWFHHLAAFMRADEKAFRELGPLDCVMVVAVTRDVGRRELFAITFAGYAVSTVRALATLADAPSSHFVIEAPLAAWRAMLENIRACGEPELAFTLNTLTLPDDPMRLDGPDQLEIDTFYRYGQSLQRFFNGAAAVPTVYRDDE
jgi:hypothetical protein